MSVSTFTFSGSCRRWSWTSNGRGNFLLQHETREKGLIQIRVWTIRIINLHPELIACFQVERRLEGQRTLLINGDVVVLVNITWLDSLPVQTKIGIKINRRWWRIKTRRSREREKINSRSRGREYPRCQIHGVSLVHPRKIERNRSQLVVKIIISLYVEMNGRWFDVNISDKCLETYRITQKDNCNWITWNVKHLPASLGSLVKSQ